MWADLPTPWQVCMEEAWAAYTTGSVPIGAAVIDCEGNTLSRGRNRIGDDHAEAGQVCQTELAHAELNALLTLGVDQGGRRTWAVYTTTEPCPLCLGAFYMSGIRTLHYAARDPWAGSTNLLGTTPYLSRKVIQVFRPNLRSGSDHCGVIRGMGASGLPREAVRRSRWFAANCASRRPPGGRALPQRGITATCE